MFGGTSLPPVGAVAQLLGMAAFTNNANSLTRQLNQINTASQRLGATSIVTWTNVSSSAVAGTSAFIRSTGLMLGAVVALGAGIKSIEASSQLEQLLKNVEVASGATEKEMANLTDTTFALSKQYGVMATEVAKAEGALARSGISTQQIARGTLEAVIALNKATQGEISLEKAAVLVVQGLNQYNLTAADAIRVTNAITGAANKSAASVTDLSEGFSQAVIPPQVGASIEQVSAALAILNSNNIRGSVSGTTLRNMFLRLLDPPKDAAQVMQKYGISIFDAQKRSVGFRGVLEQITKAFKPTGDAAKDAQRAFDAATLFGARQGSAATTFARVGIDAFDELERALREDTDALRLAERQLDTFTGQSDRFKATIVSLAEEAFLPLARSLTPVIRQVTDLLGLLSGRQIGTGFIDAANQIISLGSTLRPVLDGIAALTTSLGNLFSAASGGSSLFDTLSNALQTTGGAMAFVLGAASLLLDELAKFPPVIATLNAIMVAAPYLAVAAAVLIALSAFVAIVGFVVGPLIGAIGVVIAGFSALITVITTVGSVLLAIGGAVLAGAAALAAFALPAAGVILVLGLLVATAALVIANWNTLVNVFNTSVAAIGNALDAIANTPVTFVATFGGAVVSVTASLSDMVKAFGIAFGGMGNIVVAFANAVMPPAMKAVVQIVSAMITSVASGIPSWNSIWAAVSNAIANALSTAAENINGFLSVLGTLLKGVPIIGQVLGIAEIVSTGFSFVAKTMQSAGDSVTATVKGITDTFDGLSANIKANLAAAQASIDKFVQESQAALKAQENARALAQQKAEERQGGRRGVPPIEPPGDVGGGVTVPGLGGGGGGRGKEPSIRDLTNQIQKALADIPGAGKQLAQLLADIAKDAPERLAPMIAAIRSVKVEISQTVVAAQALAHTTAELAQVSRNISNIQAAIGRVDIQQSLATIGFEKQLLGLRLQVAQIDEQEAPLKERLVQIDREINKLQQDNLALTRERLQIQLQMLPIQNQIADVEKKITDARRENLALEQGIADATLAVLPLRQQIDNLDRQQNAIRTDDIRNTIEQLRLQVGLADSKRALLDIDQKIAAVVNKQLDLELRRRELIANQNIGNLQDQLDVLDEQLLTETNIQKLRALAKTRDTTAAALREQEKALKSVNREQDKKQNAEDLTINALEQQKQAIVDATQPVNDQIDRLQLEADIFSQIADLSKANLEAQKRALEDLAKPQEDKLFFLNQELDFEKALSDTAVARLNLEKQALLDQLQPLQDRLDLITRTQQQQALQSQIAITFLEEERRAIEAQLEPLEDRRRAIERQIATIELQRQETSLAFEEQKIALQEQLLQEQLRKAALEEQRQQQQQVFQELTLALLQALVDSKAFSEAEATEVVKRLNLWNDEVDAIQKRVVELQALDDAAAVARDFLASLADSASKTVDSVSDLGDGTEDTTLKFRDLSTTLTDQAQPAIENVTKEVDTNNRPAFEKLTKELDSNNRPAFHDLTTELNQNNRPAFENVTTELNSNNRPAFENLTNELNSNNTPAFAALDQQLRIDLASFKTLDDELLNRAIPSVETLTGDINNGLTPSLSGATSKLGEAAAAADELKQRLDAIPREITVVVNIVTRGSIPGGGGGGGTNQPPPAAGATPTPTSTPEPSLPPSSGPTGGEPTGGDVGTQSVRLSSAQATAQARTTQAVVFQENNTYTVTANYQQTQTPTSIAQDIRALIQLSQR